MKGIIFYESSWENGIEELKQIIEKYKMMQIPTVRCHYTKFGSFAEFENGDSWKVVKANESARGQRCNIAYIERCVSYDIYRCIIAPKIFDFPYAAIRLWGEGDLHLSTEPCLPF